jgi:hypothetical protein
VVHERDPRAVAGRYEISNQSITHRSLLGTFRIGWEEVLRVEFGSGAIILHGDDKRFAFSAPAFWWGKQKPEAVGLLHKKIHGHDVASYRSTTADYKVHKNVRVSAGVPNR